MTEPEPPAGSEHYREGWRHGYEQAAIDRERSADAVRLVPATLNSELKVGAVPDTGQADDPLRLRWEVQQLQGVVQDQHRAIAAVRALCADTMKLPTLEDPRPADDRVSPRAVLAALDRAGSGPDTAGRCGDIGDLLFNKRYCCELRAGHAGWHREGVTEWSGVVARRGAGAVPDTGQAREATGRRDTAVEAAVAAWRDVQPRPFVMPEEMTELAIALDELTAAHETVSALVSRETTDGGRSRDAEPSPDTGQARADHLAAGIRKFADDCKLLLDSGGLDNRVVRSIAQQERNLRALLAEPSGDTVQAPDVAALRKRLDDLDEAYFARGYTRRYGSHAQIHTSEVRALLGATSPEAPDA